MAKISKRYKAMQGLVEPGKTYPIETALKILGQLPRPSSWSRSTWPVRLGIDAKKSDQGVRLRAAAPRHRQDGARGGVPPVKAEAAKAAGADAVGMDDLAEKMQGGDLAFGRVIATPDAMRVVGKLGQLLGPRGLMPNPKDGSVTADVVTAVKNAKAGQGEVPQRQGRHRALHDRQGASFSADALKENLGALLADLVKAKPRRQGAIHLQKVSISTTMGIGITVDQSTLGVKQ